MFSGIKFQFIHKKAKWISGEKCTREYRKTISIHVYTNLKKYVLVCTYFRRTIIVVIFPF